MDAINFVLQLAYDGTPFHGWQVQENAHTVQGELESALSKILGFKVDTLGCGRTDTGVHASDFYVQFKSFEELSERTLYALNSILPKEIAVYHLYKAGSDFNVRFDAVLREYKYYITLKKDPFKESYSFYLNRRPDLKLMNEACEIIKTYTDFQCFSKVHTDVRTFNCKVSDAYWTEENEGYLVFTVTADRFLRNMVRAMVGTLLLVGKHKIVPKDIHEIIKSKNRSNAGMSVQAKGLFLNKVVYPQGVLEQIV